MSPRGRETEPRTERRRGALGRGTEFSAPAEARVGGKFIGKGIAPHSAWCPLRGTARGTARGTGKEYGDSDGTLSVQGFSLCHFSFSFPSIRTDREEGGE